MGAVEDAGISFCGLAEIAPEAVEEFGVVPNQPGAADERQDDGDAEQFSHHRKDEPQDHDGGQGVDQDGGVVGRNGEAPESGMVRHHAGRGRLFHVSGACG